MERDFKGIWIPKEIWLNEQLTVMEKLFLVEIDSLDNSQGCFASNGYFSLFFGLTKNRCSQVINELEKKGYISLAYEREGQQIVKRTIRVLNKFNRVLNKVKDPMKKSLRTYEENVKENNTSNNTSKIEATAFEFLRSKEAEKVQIWLMQWQSQITEFARFIDNYNDTVDVEQLPYKPRVLFARLNKYARNWVANQNKDNTNPANGQTDTISVEGRPWLRKIS